MVHGDLKGVSDSRDMCFTMLLMAHVQPNILIDNDKNAVLCDFGLASITADAESAHASTINSAGSIRWMAPERLSIFDGNSEPAPNTFRVTRESDMYSLAMVVIEVRTLPRRDHTWLTRISALDIHRAHPVLGHSRCRCDTQAFPAEAPQETRERCSARFDKPDLGNRRDMLEDPAVRSAHRHSGSWCMGERD